MKTVISIGSILLTMGSFGSTTTAQSFTLLDVTGTAGLLPYQAAGGIGAGVASADVDDDGDIDVFLPNEQGVPDQFYRNNGDGTFTEAAAEVGLASVAKSRIALWLDFDGDGDLDLLVGRDGWAGGFGLTTPTTRTTATDLASGGATALQLYEQDDDGRFIDVSAGSGLGTMPLVATAHLGGMCAGDINGDGFLDLCVTQWQGQTHLFLNNTNGTFTDITIPSYLVFATKTAWQPVMHDVNHDGLMDIFISIDFEPNHLFVNQGNTIFLDYAPQYGVAAAQNEMGAAFADYDNDGDFDLYTTNIFRTFLGQQQHSVLYRKQATVPNPSFLDMSFPSGTANTGWGWGLTFFDPDRNGLLDLAVTNGYSLMPWLVDTSVLFMQDPSGNGSFTEQGAAIGFNDTDWGSSLIAFDYDRDGDQDLMQTCLLDGPVRLLRNDPSGASATAHSLVVRPRMVGPNSHAIGAVVRARIGDTTLSRLISCGTGFMGQEPAEAFFGLDDADVVDEVIIEWPDGNITNVFNVAADQVITITDQFDPSLCGRTPLDGAAPSAVTIVQVLNAWGCCDDCPEDMNADGNVDERDLGLWFSTAR